jgi:hypothetical protein
MVVLVAVDPDWTGRVKVQMEGTQLFKSYLDNGIESEIMLIEPSIVDEVGRTIDPTTTVSTTAETSGKPVERGSARVHPTS